MRLDNAVSDCTPQNPRQLTVQPEGRSSTREVEWNERPLDEVKWPMKSLERRKGIANYFLLRT
jgi:hypothetical protein